MRIRCSFDTGAGVCLWAADEAARLAYGYAIAFADLSLSEDLRRRGEALLALFDTRLCWEDPTAPSPWSDDGHEAFVLQAQQYLHDLRLYVGDHIEIIDDIGAC